jgi:hypothetical protein
MRVFGGWLVTSASRGRLDSFVVSVRRWMTSEDMFLSKLWATALLVSPPGPIAASAAQDAVVHRLSSGAVR